MRDNYVDKILSYSRNEIEVMRKIISYKFLRLCIITRCVYGKTVLFNVNGFNSRIHKKKTLCKRFSFLIICIFNALIEMFSFLILIFNEI